MNAIRPYVARLLAPLITAFFVWAATHLAVSVDPELIERTTMVVVDIIIWVGTALLMGYGWIHRLINKYVNPADVAAKEATPVPPKRL